MKHILTAIFLAAITFACKPKQEIEASPSHGFIQPQAPAASGDSPADSLVMSYERTACFGQCPIYKVKVYNSGYSTYEGINFVDRIGKYSARIDKGTIETLLQKGVETGFFKMPELYRNEATDFPSKILYMKYQGRKNQVRNESAGPQELRELEKVIERTLDEIDWKPLQR